MKNSHSIISRAIYTVNYQNRPLGWKPNILIFSRYIFLNILSTSNKLYLGDATGPSVSGMAARVYLTNKHYEFKKITQNNS